MRRFILIAALVGCTDGLTGDGVDPPDDPPPGGGSTCTEACGDNAPKGEAGDPVEYLGTATDNFRSFFEPVEVEIWGDRFAMCTGVRGVAIYRNDDPCCASLEATLTPEPSRSYPRCQHVRIHDDVAYVANHGDEISPDPFVTVIDVSNLDAARTIDTYFGDGSTSFEGLEVVGDTLYVAMHEQGLGVFRIEGDGRITRTLVVTEGIENAWLPKADPRSEVLYVADAQGGVAAYSIEDPTTPRFLSKAPTEGTVKDIAIGDGVVFAAAGSAGLEVYDSSAPDALVRAHRLDTSGSAIGVSTNGAHVVVADWNDVRVFEVADPPVLIGHQKAYTRSGVPDSFGRILDVALDDDVMVMAEWAAPQTHRIISGVVSPDMLAPSTIEVPRTDPGFEAATSLVIENIGTAPLTISSAMTSSPFSIELTQTEVAPKSRVLASILFTPLTRDSAEVAAILETNDPDQPTLTVNLQGNLPGLRAGDLAPDTRFVDLDGFEHQLSDFAGGPVLLAYFATF